MGRPGRRHLLSASTVAVLAAVAAVVLPAAPAQAASYRYWTYWHGQAGAWVFASDGPAGHRVHEGDVEGWRFAVTSGTTGAGRPRVAASWTALCGGTAVVPGRVRVGLVVDFGTPGDAHPGDRPQPTVATCVSVPDTSRGSLVLTTVMGQPRLADSGLLCAIHGYPSQGCGEVVSTPAPRPTPTPSPIRPTVSATAPARTGPTTTPPRAVSSRRPGAAHPSTAAVPAVGTPPTAAGSAPADGPLGPSAASPPATAPAALPAPSGRGRAALPTVLGAGLVLLVGAGGVLRRRRGRR